MKEKLEAVARRCSSLPPEARAKELEKAFPGLKTWILEENQYLYYCVQDERCLIMTGLPIAPIPE